MIGLVLKTLAKNEMRLRMRRSSTIVALLAVAALAWAMIPDPASGNALIVIREARVLYTSSALALGSAGLSAILFGLGGFYLVRGRMSEDMRSGAGGVIGATPVSNSVFIAGRWLGGVAYLCALVGMFMLTVLALHALRGDGPIELLVYLHTFTVMLLPMLFFAVSFAILFDSIALLMGKAGDILFFFIWTAQFVLITQVDKPGTSSWAMLFDFSGLGVAVLAVKTHLATTSFSIGSSSFDPALTPLTFPNLMWSGQMMVVRALSGAIALLPLVPAVLLFHRFSPDKVKVARARQRRSPLALLNSVLRPLSALTRPLFALGGRLPGMAGQVTADVALSFTMAPSAVLALLASVGVAALADASVLPGVMAGAVACWGILISDMSTRDYAADIEDMTGVVGGGVARRYLRQFAATLVLGLMFTGVVALRWAATAPLRALAAVAGVAALSALASLFGRTSRTARLFLALFLFGLYVAINATSVAWIDAVGFNGAANTASVAMYGMIAAAALAAGYIWNR